MQKNNFSKTVQWANLLIIFQSSQTEGSFGEDGNSSRGEQLKPNFNL